EGVQFLGQRTSAGVKIRGIEHLTRDEIEARLAAGGRFVFYEYCISLLLVTFRRPSSIFFLRPGERGGVRSLPYVLASLLFGWWGLPGGPWFPVAAVFSNLGGGHDVTDDVRQFLGETAQVEPV